MPANLLRSARRRLHSRDAGFTLVEMTVAVTVVLLMAAVALLAAPGIVKDATKSSCNAVADSVNNAITASYASHTNYSRTSAANLVSDNYLVSAPDSDQLVIGSASDDGVTVTFGPSCTGDTAPITWGAAAASAAKYAFGDGGGPILTKPSVPQNFTANPADTKIIMAWNEPADTGGGPITNYTVVLQETSGGNPVGQAFEPTGCTSLTGSNLTCTATGLTNGTTYDAGIMAKNASQTSDLATVTGVVPHTLSCAEGGTCTYGDTGPGGGTVFYVDDNGFTSNGHTDKYLEVAPSNWAGGTDPNKYFGCQGSNISGANNTGIGQGADNTAALVAAASGDCSSSAPQAAQAAVAYHGNGKTDWYLPSREELNQLCLAATGAPNGPTTLGNTCPGSNTPTLGLSNTYYFASTQDSQDASFKAVIVDMPSGSVLPRGKNLLSRMRPIRAFAPIG